MRFMYLWGPKGAPEASGRALLVRSALGDVAAGYVGGDRHAGERQPRADGAAREEAARARGIAGGLFCLQVDGNDLIAVLEGMRRAITRARNGEGGSCIEFMTYRLHDHTTADDARRYRGEDEVKAAWAREPHVRLRNYLTAAGAWTEAQPVSEEGSYVEIGDVRALGPVQGIEVGQEDGAGRAAHGDRPRHAPLGERRRSAAGGRRMSSRWLA